MAATHPGKYIREVYLGEYEMSEEFLLGMMSDEVDRETMSGILSETVDVTPEIAYALEGKLHRSKESWLSMQSTYNKSL